MAPDPPQAKGAANSPRLVFGLDSRPRIQPPERRHTGKLQFKPPARVPAGSGGKPAHGTTLRGGGNIGHGIHNQPTPAPGQHDPPQADTTPQTPPDQPEQSECFATTKAVGTWPAPYQDCHAQRSATSGPQQPASATAAGSPARRAPLCTSLNVGNAAVRTPTRKVNAGSGKPALDLSPVRMDNHYKKLLGLDDALPVCPAPADAHVLPKHSWPLAEVLLTSAAAPVTVGGPAHQVQDTDPARSASSGTAAPAVCSAQPAGGIGAAGREHAGGQQGWPQGWPQAHVTDVVPGDHAVRLSAAPTAAQASMHTVQKPSWPVLGCMDGSSSGMAGCSPSPRLEATLAGADAAAWASEARAHAEHLADQRPLAWSGTVTPSGAPGPLEPTAGKVHLRGLPGGGHTAAPKAAAGVPDSSTGGQTVWSVLPATGLQAVADAAAHAAGIDVPPARSDPAAGRSIPGVSVCEQACTPVSQGIQGAALPAASLPVSRTPGFPGFGRLSDASGGLYSSFLPCQLPAHRSSVSGSGSAESSAPLTASRAVTPELLPVCLPPNALCTTNVAHAARRPSHGGSSTIPETPDELETSQTKDPGTAHADKGASNTPQLHGFVLQGTVDQGAAPTACQAPADCQQAAPAVTAGSQDCAAAAQAQAQTARCVDAAVDLGSNSQNRDVNLPPTSAGKAQATEEAAVGAAACHVATGTRSSGGRRKKAPRLEMDPAFVLSSQAHSPPGPAADAPSEGPRTRSPVPAQEPVKAQQDPVHHQQQRTPRATEAELQSSTPPLTAGASSTENGASGSLQSVDRVSMVSQHTRLLECYLQPAVAKVMRSKDGCRMGDAMLYEWQVQALNAPGVLDGKNFVYCAPTSGGKSLVAEILALRRLYIRRKAILLVLPFVSLCAERAAHWEKLMAPLGYKVHRLYSNLGKASSLPANAGVVVCTIEKANSLVTRVMEEGCLQETFSAVIVDELHLVDDEDRGYLMELLLTKLRFMARPRPSRDNAVAPGKDAASTPGSDVRASGSPHLATEIIGSAEESPTRDCELQVIGMSATLPNLELIGRWLEAATYITDYRPINLEVSILHGKCLRSPRTIEGVAGGGAEAKVEWSAHQLDTSAWDCMRDKDLLGFLVNETVQDLKSVLIFCGTRLNVESTAVELAALCTDGQLRIPEREVPTGWAGQASSGGREAFIANMSPTIPQKLRECFEAGIGYHHAKLMPESREACEYGFRTGAISVLVATSTVATGVNLPAQRVIVRDTYIGRPTNPLDPARFRQMAGRAGRAGIDTKGEAIVVQNGSGPGHVQLAESLVTSKPPPVSSCLESAKRGFDRIMLEVVVSGAVKSPPDVLRLISCTLLSAEYCPDGGPSEAWQQEVAESCKNSLQKLGDQGFLDWKVDKERKGGGHYRPLQLGRAAVAAGLPPEEALMVHEDIRSVARAVSLESDLHLMYLVAPVEAMQALDWGHVANILQAAHDRRRHVQDVVRLAEIKLNLATMAGRKRKRGWRPEAGTYVKGHRVKPDEMRKLYKLYQALVLEAIVDETPLKEVVGTFFPLEGRSVDAAVERLQKDVGELQEQAAKSAGRIAAFCERIGLNALDILVSRFHGRVLNGVKDDVVDLTNIKGVRGYTARLLYTAGLKTVEDVTNASVHTIQCALVKGKRHESTGGEWRQARRISKSARDVLKERAAAAAASAGLDAEQLLLADDAQQVPASPYESQPHNLHAHSRSAQGNTPAAAAGAGQAGRAGQNAQASHGLAGEQKVHAQPPACPTGSDPPPRSAAAPNMEFEQAPVSSGPVAMHAGRPVPSHPQSSNLRPGLQPGPMQQPPVSAPSQPGVVPCVRAHAVLRQSPSHQSNAAPQLRLHSAQWLTHPTSCAPQENPRAVVPCTSTGALRLPQPCRPLIMDPRPQQHVCAQVLPPKQTVRMAGKAAMEQLSTDSATHAHRISAPAPEPHTRQDSCLQHLGIGVTLAASTAMAAMAASRSCGRPISAPVVLPVQPQGALSMLRPTAKPLARAPSVQLQQSTAARQFSAPAGSAGKQVAFNAAHRTAPQQVSAATHTSRVAHAAAQPGAARAVANVGGPHSGAHLSHAQHLPPEKLGPGIPHHAAQRALAGMLGLPHAAGAHQPHLQSASTSSVGPAVRAAAQPSGVAHNAGQFAGTRLPGLGSTGTFPAQPCVQPSRAAGSHEGGLTTGRAPSMPVPPHQGQARSAALSLHPAQGHQQPHSSVSHEMDTSNTNQGPAHRADPKLSNAGAVAQTAHEPLCSMPAAPGCSAALQLGRNTSKRSAGLTAAVPDAKRQRSASKGASDPAHQNAAQTGGCTGAPGPHALAHGGVAERTLERDAAAREDSCADAGAAPPAAALPPLSDAKDCKAYFDGLAPGLHMMQTVADVRRLCVAVAGCSEVAVVLVRPTEVQRANQEREDLQMPPSDSEEMREFLQSKSRKRRTERQRAGRDAPEAVLHVELEGILFCWSLQRIFFVLTRLPKHKPRSCPDVLQYWPDLQTALQTPNRKVMHGAKGVVHALRMLGCGPEAAEMLRGWLPPRGLGLTVGGNLADVRLAAGLLQPGHALTSDDAARSFHAAPAAEPAGPAEHLLKRVHELAGWPGGQPPCEPPPDASFAAGQGQRFIEDKFGMHVRAAREAMHTLALHWQLGPVLKAQGLEAALLRIEQPLIPVLADMEAGGVPVDPRAVQAQMTPLQGVQERLVQAVKAVARRHGIHDFDTPAAGHRVQSLLWDKLGLRPPPNSKVTQRGVVSTSCEVLEELYKQPGCPEVVKYIMQYRSNGKLLEFLETLQLKLGTAPAFTAGGRCSAAPGLLSVQSRVQQAASDTGRLSMEEPNFQCMPKARTADAPEPDGTLHTFYSNIRAVVRAPAGWKVVSVDYRQIEFRIMAHLAQEPRLLETFRSAQADPFQAMAAELHGCHPSAVAKELRDRVKQMVYGLSYGMGAAALSKKLDCDVNSAQTWKEDLLRRYPQLRIWQQQLVQSVRSTGYVSTQTSGRKRWLPAINSRDGSARASAERAAINTACQSAAADIAKLAMVRLKHALEEAELALHVYLCLQIHDELLFVVRDEHLATATDVIRACMEGLSCCDLWTLSVPLPVQIQVGPSWGELQLQNVASSAN